MNDLSKLAKIASRNECFLGSILESIAIRDGLSDSTLANHLGCSTDALDRLRLCRTPSEDPLRFALEVRRIAEYCDVDFTSLVSIIKDASISASMQGTASEVKTGWLMAARDRDDDSA